MTLIQDVPVGAMIFLECGCRGHRLTPRSEEQIVVTVEEPCRLHESRGQHIKYLEPLTSVSAFTKATE
jgi:hypothetical protein